MKNVLVTGGNGFIGRHLVNYLLEQADVGRVGVIDPQLRLRRSGDGIDWERYYSANTDIADVSSFGIASPDDVQWDTVIHLAATSGVKMGEDNPGACMHNNVTATADLIRLCQEHDVDQVIFASSSTVYGENDDGALLEDDMDLNTSAKGIYGLSKRFGEQLLTDAYRRGAFDLTILRLFSVIGPGLRSDLAASIFYDKVKAREPATLFGAGLHQRDMTDVRDVVVAFGAAMRTVGNGEAINIGASEPVVMRDVLQYIQDVLDPGHELRHTDHPARDYEMHSTHADNSKAFELLDWKPDWSWHQALLNFLAWKEGIQRCRN